MRGKKTKRKWFRNILILLILILVLMVLDNRFGLGSGLSSLLDPASETTEAMTTEPTASDLSARTIRVSEQKIFLDDVEFTLEGLIDVLNASDAKVVYTLKDDLANHALFVEIETVLDELKLIYTLE